MLDTTSPATADTTSPGTPDVGEMIGDTVAGIVILNMRAMQAGLAHGWEHEQALAHHAAHPQAELVLAGCVVPDEYARFADGYRDMFDQGRAEYREQHPAATAPAATAQAVPGTA